MFSNLLLLAMSALPVISAMMTDIALTFVTESEVHEHSWFVILAVLSAICVNWLAYRFILAAGSLIQKLQTT